MGFEDEVEQSIGRPCCQSDNRSKRTYELTSSIVPRGTSFHRWVELEFPPIAFDPARSSCCRSLPGPAELGPINPDAAHDHGQPACQRDDRLFHPAAPGDLHRPGLEPRPFLRSQHLHETAWWGWEDSNFQPNGYCRDTSEPGLALIDLPAEWSRQLHQMLGLPAR
jgi:hypothetical protein